jgi:hypothetical protein
VSSSLAEIHTQKDEAEVQDWRMPIISYLKDPGCGAERNIRRLAFKYVLVDDELYRRTADDILLKCLGTDQARVAMGEVHEGIYGTHCWHFLTQSLGMVSSQQQRQETPGRCGMS